MSNIPVLFFFKSGDNNEKPFSKSLDVLESQDLRDLENLGYKWFKKGFQNSLSSIKDAYREVDYTFEDEVNLMMGADSLEWERDFYNEDPDES